MRIVRIALCLVTAFGALAGVRTAKSNAPVDLSGGFDPAQSAALFVGVREFTHDESLAEVRYAVDDAIDLAYALSLDTNTPLVEPKRVVLALSGDPQKSETEAHLDALIRAGATLRTASHSDVLELLDAQSRAAGPRGLLLLAFATHGVSAEGVQYLLTASSLLQHRETAIPDTEIREIASHSDAARSLILIDACRKRLTTDTREGDADPRSAAAWMREMAGISGQVVFSAAAAGEYAYDDETRRNGVFTAALIDGVRCGAAHDANGFVTIETLAAYVEEHVLTWIRKNRDRDARKATQLQSEGRARLMPLSHCAQ